MSKSRNGVKASIFGVLGALAIMTVILVPAYADPIVKPTSAGTLNISFETNPATPNPGDQTELKISFLNKQNTVQQHIDYRVSMTQGGNQVFGTQVTHTAEGSVSIPFQFQSAGTYQVTVEVQGILFQPIPPETASFTVVVGPSVPEFGPLAGMIIAVSITSVIIISKRTHLHI
ncbi:MAG: PEFG-CTERM sorting domain-containing protein [Thaumarchaeota archaeon]|nr:PEFG-CTERM sorting domain-containing protein [Nitrososphaerota archaeon]MDE1840336.1 PEFG-CTERM sorting domain-containing protein [Nitrososphaerota archaeon]MDE1876936.1 PEFG-CTERM sorting domain-containing protein [Nitrososphaerota archaeon]